MTEYDRLVDANGKWDQKQIHGEYIEDDSAEREVKEIRIEYTKHLRGGLSDSGAFERCAEKHGFKKAVQALLPASKKAKAMKAQYPGGARK